jgi:hypothetical protein
MIRFDVINLRTICRQDFRGSAKSNQQMRKVKMQRNCFKILEQFPPFSARFEYQISISIELVVKSLQGIYGRGNRCTDHSSLGSI